MIDHGVLGDFLRDIRENKYHMGYNQFCEEVLKGELSHQALRNIEAGKAEAKISTLAAITELLELDLHLIAHLAFGLPLELEDEGAIAKILKEDDPDFRRDAFGTFRKVAELSRADRDAIRAVVNALYKTRHDRRQGE